MKLLLPTFNLATSLIKKSSLSQLQKDNANLFLWSLLLTPMARYVRPNIIERNEERIVLSINLTRRTNTEYNSMFFGALATGFDMTGGMLAHLIAQDKYPSKSIGFIYKDVKIDFLKRADGDVHFVCNEGIELTKSIQYAVESGDRITQEVKISAYVHQKSMIQPVATAICKLSMKVR